MFKIGDFSRFSRVSIKMLRHYDELELLKPAQVDPFTGYRYYTADQLPRLNRIIALKDLGFTLEQIGGLLDDDLSVGEIRGMLKLKRAEVEQRLREEENRLMRIENRLNQIELQETLPPYDVVIRQIAPQTVAGIREIVPSDSERVTELFELLEQMVARYHARADRPPLLIYHDADYRDSERDIEVAVPLNGAMPGNDRVCVYELPGYETMACVVHQGDYPSMYQASNVLFSWIDKHGYDIEGPSREVFLRFGADNEGYTLPHAFLTTRSGEFVTELQIPVRKS